MKLKIRSFLLILLCVCAANIVLLPVSLYVWRYPLDKVMPAASEYVESLFACHIPCKLQKHPTLKDKYKPDLPIFLDASNAEPYLSDHLQLVKHPYIRNTLEQLELLNKARDLHGKRYKTCAVVGNSQNLSQSDYGQLIDSHEAVWRMNSGPTKGFEQDVGSKTTIRIFPEGRQYTLHGKQPIGKDTILLRSAHTNGMNRKEFHKFFSQRTFKFLYKVGISWFPDNVANLSKLTKIPEYLKKLSPRKPTTKKQRDHFQVRNQLHITHPKLYQDIELNWFTPKRRNSNPSMGFFALITALHMCDEVNAFGYGLNKNGKWGHYYEKRLVRPVHKYSFQESFMKMLEKDGIITIYRGAE